MSKEYEIKPKMVQEQWLQLQMTFLLGYNLKRLFSRDELTFGGKGINIWLGGRSLLGGGGVCVEFLQLEEESANFWLVWNPPPPPPSHLVGKTLHIIMIIPCSTPCNLASSARVRSQDSHQYNKTGLTQHW